MNRVHITYTHNGDVLRYELEGDTQYHHGTRAIRLAPTLDVCRALAAGEAVPLNRLDPTWLERYGLRR